MGVLVEGRENAASACRTTGVVSGSSEVQPTFSTKDDFAHMCCAADLVAASMFLQSLEEHERRHIVVSACKSLCWLEQPDEVEDKSFVEAIEEDAIVEQPCASSLDCTIGRCWWHLAGGDVSGN